MRSVIFFAIVFSVLFVFADGNTTAVNLNETCKSFIEETTTFKIDLDACQAKLQKCQQDLKEAVDELDSEVADPEEAKEPAAPVKVVTKTAEIEKKVQASNAPASVKKEVEKRAEAVYKSYVQEDGQALKKYAELENFLRSYVNELKIWTKAVDKKIAEIEKKTLENSVNILVLKETDKIQDKEIAAVAKRVENSRIKFEIFLNGGYTTVENGSVNLGVGTLIPVGKNRLFDIELAAFAGIATSNEMGIVGFLVATPFAIKEWKKVTLSIVPEANFLMTMDIVGNSGSDTLEAQKGKIFSYTANGAIGIKALFGEYWFLSGKAIMGYAYEINPKNYEEKNSLNIGFAIGGGVQF